MSDQIVVTMMNLGGRHIVNRDGLANVAEAANVFYANETAPADLAAQLNGAHIAQANFEGTPLRTGDTVLFLEGKDASKTAHSGA